MKTLIVTEVRVFFSGENYYTSEAFSYILERYYKKFENITLLTRIIKTDVIPNGYVNINCYCSDFINYGSITKAFLTFNNKIFRKYVSECDFVILRVPSIVSIPAYKFIKKFKKKYMIEAMGCAWDGYWNHDIIGKFVALYGFLWMKKIVYNADFATYVTEKFLQKRYPCKNKSIGVSNVNIDDIYIHNDYSEFDKNNISLMTAAAVNVRFKGQAYVIKAIHKLKKMGINVKYYLAGGGDNKYLKSIAKRYNVEQNVIFLGLLPRNEILDYMKKTDIYIQPSLQEGLPRSMIEAMSCGCVCLGARTAGIPELIDSKYVFKRKSVEDIVRKIVFCCNENLEYVSKINSSKARKFLRNNINKKRFDYYDNILKSLK